MKWTVPNILTLLRLLAAPGVPLMFLYFSRPFADFAALALFVVAAITDWIDGHLARSWQQESRFGAAMDPIADKAMVVIALSVIVGLSQVNPLILLPVAFILLREVFVSGLREFLGMQASRLKVTPLAKWKTFVQMVAIPVLLVADALAYGLENGEHWVSVPFHGWATSLAGNAGLLLIWVAGLLTVVTGWDYLVKAMPYLRDHKQ